MFKTIDNRPTFFPSRRTLMWPNKAVGHIFGANFFDQLRGPQFDLVWIDEMAKFSHPDLVWQQVDMALRLGTFPRCIITTTPRPIKILQDLVQDSTCVVTTGSTFDNAANLAPSFLAHMKKTYSHTSLGQQELYGKILTQREGALWSRSMFRYEHVNIDRLRRLVIAVDPAITCHAQSDETGIVVVGQTEDGTGVLINDLSGKFPPSDWSRKVVEAYWYYKADRVVAEMNRGGDMVEKMIKSVDPTVSFKGVRATRGKIIRAEPVAALYEQKKVVHLQCFERLEEQLCHYTHDTTGYSPDRLDALVWGLSEIFLTHPTQEIRVWG